MATMLKEGEILFVKMILYYLNLKTSMNIENLQMKVIKSLKIKKKLGTFCWIKLNYNVRHCTMTHIVLSTLIKLY